MDQESFETPQVENLDFEMIQENQTNDIKEEQIKDQDILFFSQYGHLEETAADTNFELLSGINDGLSNMGCDLVSLPQPKASNSPGVFKNDPVERYWRTKMKDVDGKNVKTFECGICGKEFGHQYTLMRHLPTHTDERKYHCATCGKSFRQMSTLSQHKAIHSTERPYICEVCNKNFNRVSTLISHRKTHSNVKPHCCHICEKSFHQKGNLRNHIFTHTNERPYKCDVCDKGFNQMSNLMCHKLKAHQEGDWTPRYICRICGNQYTKRASLRQHEHYQHGVMPKIKDSNHFDHHNAVVVNPIRTKAMQDVIESGGTPFALLRPLSGIPVLVRVEVAGDRHMLVPATAEDLKKAGHISIKPKIVEEAEASQENENKALNGTPKTAGSVVQISVPVVATIIQKSLGRNGAFHMKVVSPGHGQDSKEEGPSTSNVVYSSSIIQDMSTAQSPADMEMYDHKTMVMDASSDSSCEVVSVDSVRINSLQQNPGDLTTNMDIVAPEDVIDSQLVKDQSSGAKVVVEVNELFQ
ncbi:hypothetical protein GWI33_016412 [Rhynchophorus ferrugineus]|uniref:C2H2-type domain-containing protein n=1 Tax=Rhynchophorus ferrugineus TaxID=354439 RepID=A0A834M740_RHYFE|nr:hypothetical protein GWI33_016412 [Rhynchophorus ferrugineus]